MEDTKKLLEECNSGCKMAINSIEQVLEYAKDVKQKEILMDYKEQHEHLEQESSMQLKEAGWEEKEPKAMASAMSWFTTEIKMMKEDDSHQIAKLMMDGCNMGVQSVCEYQNRYPNASGTAKAIAENLIRVEEKFYQKMKPFL